MSDCISLDSQYESNEVLLANKYNIRLCIKLSAAFSLVFFKLFDYSFLLNDINDFSKMENNTVLV